MKKLILLVLIFTSSCAFKRQVYEHGDYGDKKLSDDTFLVSFRGGSNSQHVQNMLYVRCSEIALENGYPYFVVLENNWQKKEITDRIGLVTYSKTLTYTNKIKLLLQPHQKLQNFDAKAIYAKRIREINQED